MLSDRYKAYAACTNQSQMCASCEEYIHAQEIDEDCLSERGLLCLTCFIGGDWTSVFEKEKKKPYWTELNNFVESERNEGIVHPPEELVFNSFELTPYSSVKVCIIGQDPYHGMHLDTPRAHGLSFSVPVAVPIPPSLRAILRESGSLKKDGDLSEWAKQGVLLLNRVLTVRHQSPRSHANRGWERFTLEIVRALSVSKNRIIFMLWGNDAQLFEDSIDDEKHLVLCCGHPSPLARRARNPFRGCNHFEIANRDLQEQGREPIQWWQ